MTNNLNSSSRTARLLKIRKIVEIKKRKRVALSRLCLGCGRTMKEIQEDMQKGLQHRG